MWAMFEAALAFNQYIGNWNTAKVTSMYSMFSEASNFNQDIGNWNTSSVTDMRHMFYKVSSFNQDIGSWNISNVTDMTNMFSNVKLSTHNYDSLLNGWDVQILQPNVKFNGGNSNYCTGETARENMINTDGWTITDGGKDCSSQIVKKVFRPQATYDGWVLESGEFSGKGGKKNKLGKILKVGDDKTDRQYRTILSFGTAGIPDNAVITKVILKVRKAGVVGTNPMKTHNGLVVDIKKFKFYTLPALQINDFQAKASKYRVGKFSKKLFSGWYKAVLNDIAIPYINKTGRTQFRIRFLLDDNDDNGADILKFYSGNAVLAKRPKLIVKYYVP
jgi:surface protein